jgi:hypothetical protein
LFEFLDSSGREVRHENIYRIAAGYGLWDGSCGALPAYPQKVDEKTMLNQLSVDMINHENTLKQMQDGVGQTHG